MKGYSFSAPGRPRPGRRAGRVGREGPPPRCAPATGRSLPADGPAVRRLRRLRCPAPGRRTAEPAGALLALPSFSRAARVLLSNGPGVRRWSSGRRRRHRRRGVSGLTSRAAVVAAATSSAGTADNTQSQLDLSSPQSSFLCSSSTPRAPGSLR